MFHEILKAPFILLTIIWLNYTGFGLCFVTLLFMFLKGDLIESILLELFVFQIYHPISE